MDQITLDRIKFLHPKVRQEALEAYKQINNFLLGKGVRLRFAYTLRSNAEQDELYAQGRTKLFDAKGNRLGKVTGAKGGQSIHNYGLALDIVLLLDKDNNGTFETASWDIVKDFDNDGIADWMEVVNYFKKLGWSWGGDWKSLYDPPHLEKTFGYEWKDLLTKVKMNQTFLEVIDGKKYYWVNI
ncbi:M15 family metallopeptidase [Flavobacterium hauense]